MKLFEFCGAETDWVAANSEAEARAALKGHYGIDDRDIDGSYSEVSEIDPATVELELDETDAETGDSKVATAAEVMAGKTRPFLVASTYQ